MFKQSNIDEKSGLELELAKDFMRWVTGHKPYRIRKLDINRERRRPDFAFYYVSGQRYTLEIERWLTPELRQLQAQAEKSVAKPLANRLVGTFILDIPFSEFKDGQIPQKEASRIVSEILQIVHSGMGHETYVLGKGLSISKVSDDGKRLYIMVTEPEPAVYLDENNQQVMVLRKKLKEIVLKSHEKFRCYRGTRVLLLDISQCGLDIDYHGEGPGIVCKWLEELLKSSARIEYVCLGQMRLWKGASGDRILAGHKYVDKPPPNYQEVWRRSGLPRILSSFIESGSNLG